METSRIKIALQSKGRLASQSKDILAKAGFKFRERSNALTIRSSNYPLDLLLVRDDDIPNLVNQGIADLGIIGANVLKEQQLSKPLAQIETIKNLGFSKCRLSLAVRKDQNIRDLNNTKIATSYPAILNEYLSDNNIDAEIINIHGSVELTPFIGIADLIFDLVSTGATLESNNLKEFKTVMSSEAVLIGNPQADESKTKSITRLVSRITSVIEADESKYVMFNALEKDASKLIELLPGVESPTVIPLADKNKVAIHAVCKETVFWETIETLKENGASSLLVLPIEKWVS